MIGLTFYGTAVLKDSFYQHFGIRPTIASMYGAKPEDIVNVAMTVAAEQSRPPAPQDTPKEQLEKPDYWGWWSHKDKRFTQVRAKFFLLEVCFPYGINAQEERGEGKAYRLTVKPK